MNQICPLCSRPFEDRGAQCRSRCPLARRCGVARCPHCGYAFPRDSSIARWFGKAYRAARQGLARCRPRARMAALSLRPAPEREPARPAGAAGAPAACPLTAWPIEVPAQVAGFAPAAREHLVRLVTYGLTEGSVLTVRRKRSAYILGIEHTDLAIDANLAREIFVGPVAALAPCRAEPAQPVAIGAVAAEPPMRRPAPAFEPAA